MTSLRHTLSALAAALALAGCEDTRPAIAPEPPDPDVELSFSVPELNPLLLVDRTVDSVAADNSRPAEAGMDTPYEEGAPESTDELTMISSPRTNVGFNSTNAYSTGKHDYTGNWGRVETTATVKVGYETIGSQHAYAQRSHPFLTNLGRRSFINKTAYVQIFDTCGLHVEGDSGHYAGWEFFQGTRVSEWGKSEFSTTAEPAFQPACQPANDHVGGGGGGGGDESEEVVMCYYLIEYDLMTSMIYNVEFLYCLEIVGGYV